MTFIYKYQPFMLRTIILAGIICLSSLCGFSQSSGPAPTGFTDTSLGYPNASATPLSYSSYTLSPEWKRYRRLNTVGWCAFGVGTATALFGGLWQVAALAADGGADFAGGPLVCVAVGGSMMVASVPILITARHYKRKAKNLTLNLGVTALNTPRHSSRPVSTPALGLTLTF